MKKTMKLTLAMLALGVSALAVHAQDANGAPGDGTNGPRFGGHRPPPSPLVMALDVNHDGVIDSNEIANASAELKTLDKNGYGQLTPDEFAPRPPRRGNHSADGDGNSSDDAPPGPPPNE